jgi:C1A family cysteine protease
MVDVTAIPTPPSRPPFIAKLGWLRDPHKRPGETQDLDAGHFLRAVPVPLSASVEQYSKIIDQGSLGSCVLNATAQAVYICHARAGIKQPKLLSRLFGYYFSRAYHHQTGEDSGTFLRYAFASLNKFGFCPEELWTYDDGPDKFKQMPSGEAIRGAFDQHTPTVYQRIYDDGDARLLAIKQAIASGYAVAFGTDVSVRFTENDLGADPLQPPLNEGIAGGHAMCVVGYETVNGIVRFKIANSWSPNWGQSGYCYFSAEYMKWANTNDLWIVNSAPNYS